MAGLSSGLVFQDSQGEVPPALSTVPFILNILVFKKRDDLMLHV